jgi:hypothetical protein
MMFRTSSLPLCLAATLLAAPAGPLCSPELLAQDAPAIKSAINSALDPGDAEQLGAGLLQAALPPEVTSLFPIGRAFKGVSIPSYQGTELRSVMHAEVITRVDEQYLDLVKLVISVFNSAGEPDTTISMDEAAYDLVLGELRSKTPATIAQAQFTLTGETMIFDAASQVSRLVGNVRLVIPDIDSIAQFGPALPVGK